MRLIGMLLLPILCSVLLFRFYRILSCEAWYVFRLWKVKRTGLIGCGSLFLFMLTSSVGFFQISRLLGWVSFPFGIWDYVLVLIPLVLAFPAFIFQVVAWWYRARRKAWLAHASERLPAGNTVVGWFHLLTGLYLACALQTIAIGIESMQELEVFSAIPLILMLIGLRIGLKKGYNYSVRPCQSGVKLQKIVHWRQR